MDSADSLLYLIEEVRSKVTGLEKAVDDIHHVKKSLKVASSDVKAQIRDSISRHLEALRNREIWLLSQVELIQQGKEEVLLQKQVEIIEMVGGLKKMCALLEQSVEEEKLGEVEFFETQLSELLTSVEKMSISPEETSNICFKAQNLELLESIRGFGHVEGEACMDQSHLALLFNGINLTGLNSSPPNNKRKFFSPSGPIENWLLQGKKLQQNQSIPATSVSVEKWLTKCHPYSCLPDQEVASDLGGSVNSFDLSELKWTLAAETNQFHSGQDSFGNYFQEVKKSAIENWIKPSSNLPEQSNSKVLGKTYSTIVAMGNENWLLYKQERSNQRNFPEYLGSIHREEGSNLKWLRRSKSNEDLSKTSTDKAFTNIANTSVDHWLKSKVSSKQLKCNSKSPCAECDCTSKKDDGSDFSDTKSDADWLKVKEEDIVSIENLDSIFRFKSRKSADQDINWLVGSSVNTCSTEEDRSGIKKYGQMLQAQPNEDWLQSTRMKSEEIVQPNFMQGFLESQPNDYNKWLSKPTTNSVSADTCKWLAQNSLDHCKNCPEMCSKRLFTLFEDMKDASNDDWLKKSNQ